jgi:hypothetical protein
MASKIVSRSYAQAPGIGIQAVWRAGVAHQSPTRSAFRILKPFLPRSEPGWPQLQIRDESPDADSEGQPKLVWVNN